MAEIKLTKEQQKVVDTRNCNLLVAAAAGSGKTAVLVKRIIKKVTDTKQPQDIDRLLIVTFTNAAAAEMRERIGAAIEEALEAEPENKHLQRQMLLLHNAQITTIHSFCLSVIREFFHLLHLDPVFRIGDEAELSLLKSDVLETVLEEFYEKEDEAFTAFVESYGSTKNDTQVAEYIKKLYEIAMSHLWPQDWLDSLVKSFHISEEEWKEHPMIAQIMQEVRNTLSDCLCVADKMIALTEELDGPSLYRECFIQDKRQIEQLVTAAKEYETFSIALSALKFGRLPAKKQEVSEEKKQLAKNLREHIKKQLGKLQEDFFYRPISELWKETIQMEFPMRGLILVTKEFLSRYQKQKREKNLLDFNDLEHMALQILVKQTDKGVLPTEAARTLAARYDEIMIDEYQDSNLIQEAILNSVSKEWDGTPNVFMVGDVKQSIYRFRMACPTLFMEKYRNYKEEGFYQKIDLHKNFRSREGILNAINVLFAGLMHEESTEVEYDSAAALYYGADYSKETKEHRTEVLFVKVEQEQNSKEEQEDIEEAESEKDDIELSQEELTMVQAEALAVATRIRELIASGFPIGKEQKPVDYGDIVILLRTMSGWSEKFLEVLAEQGIPAYADTSAGYFKSFEIRKALDFLRILDNPKQDIPFAAVLHSPIAGFCAQDLAKLRVQYGVISKEDKKNRCLYDAAREAAKAEPEGRAAKFFALYDRLRAEADYISIHELIERFYEYSGFYDVVTVMTGGERRRGNLDMLLAKAKQYEATSFSGLYDFIRYMDKLIKYEVDFGEASSGECGKMVRIMSIHKSKGLEFPVVFLSGMEKKMNRQDIYKRLIFHQELGLGPEFVDTTLRVKSPTLLKKTIAKKMNEELIAEELRVLYVAMTRAKEKLILTGAMKKPEKRYETWQEQAQTIGEQGLLFSYVAKAKTYYDFICPLLFSCGISNAILESENALYSVNSEVASTCEEARKEIFEYRKQIGQEDLLTGILANRKIQLSQQSFLGQFYLKEVGTKGLEEELQFVEKTKEELLFVLEQLGDKELEKDSFAKELHELLVRQEGYVYPYEEEAKLPAKVTVSELKRLSLEEEAVVESLVEESVGQEVCVETKECSYPEFLLPEKELSGSDRGTAYHRVMELLPLETDITRSSLTTILDMFVQEGRLRPNEREVISEYKLWRFLTSRLGKKMQTAAKAGRLHREQPFVLGLPAKELYSDSESTELVLVQGIIDAFFEEEDGLVLLDYKTDYIHFDAKEELTKKYKGQLKYYKKALESLKRKKVKEVWFYSFSGDLDFIVHE